MIKQGHDPDCGIAKPGLEPLCGSRTSFHIACLTAGF